MVLAGGPAALITVRHLDHRYGPIEAGFFGGIYSEGNLVIGHDGFSERLVRTPGATALLSASISNRGSHSVEITSVDTTRW